MRGRLFVIMMLMAAPSAAQAGDDMPLARAPSEMTGAEIDAHNEGLANADPNYIRCRKIEEVGSLVKKLRVCNTNAQWKKITDKGNQDARDSMEMMARGWSVPQEPVDQLGPAINRPQ